MTPLSRNFLITLSVITFIFISIISFSGSSSERDASIKNLHLLTTLPSTVDSTPFLGKRVAAYDDSSNRLYPQMSESTQRNFVYVK